MSKQANLYKFLIEMGRIMLEEIPAPYKEEIIAYYKEHGDPGPRPMAPKDGNEDSIQEIELEIKKIE